MLEDLGKLIVAKGFKKLPKVQKIARSGHTGRGQWKFLHFFGNKLSLNAASAAAGGTDGQFEDNILSRHYLNKILHICQIFLDWILFFVNSKNKGATNLNGSFPLCPLSSLNRPLFGYFRPFISFYYPQLKTI